MLTLTEAVGKVSELRLRSKTIVFTNGCFDIIHPGHIYLLEKACSLGDFLFVGLNTDDSVSRLKGSSRPVNSLDVRIKVLCALSFVDAVIPFEQDTPLELIEHLLPDILVKGGDYTPDTVVGNDVVKQSGGKTVIIPLLDGWSTSSIISEVGSGEN